MCMLFRILPKSVGRVMFLWILAIGVFSGCAVPWSKALQYGQPELATFRDSVAIAVQRDLIFIPVTIEGATYRFLFDTGAPLSISEELQTTHAYKKVSEGNIIDSDNNRRAVNWVSVNAIGIGGVNFKDQTAFVGDFQSNPLLKCLEIDGIIGGNLIRHCNWTIDREGMSLHVYSADQNPSRENATAIPFTTDNQFNIYTSLPIGNATVKNVLVDYGSNGAVAVSEQIFNTLKQQGIIENAYFEKGVNQSGIIGNEVPLDREITQTNSIRFGNEQLQDLVIRTGPTTSIGNGLLSRFIVHIDWQENQLYLTPRVTQNTARKPAGFRLGYNDTKGIYVQSVIEKSDAWNKGLRPMQKVLKIDDLSLVTFQDFCSYVNHYSGNKIYLEWIDEEGKAQQATLSRGFPQ